MGREPHSRRRRPKEEEGDEEEDKPSNFPPQLNLLFPARPAERSSKEGKKFCSKMSCCADQTDREEKRNPAAITSKFFFLFHFSRKTREVGREIMS